MKHIKKKFRFEKQLNNDEFSEFEKNHLTYSVDAEINVKPDRSQKVFLMTENRFIIESFFMNFNGNKIYIPEPDPTLIYFNNAYFYYRDIEKQRKELNKYFATVKNKHISDELKHKLYNYYGVACGCIIFLFLCIESMINRIIPENFTYIVEGKSKTEIYNIDQIQRYLSFDDKYLKILPLVIHKNFEKQYPLKHQLILKLKDFRDSIIHTKTQTKEYTPYAHIFKNSFNFKYEDAMNVVKDFVNFLQPDFIEDCQCGQDF